jgi:hypothetical protein
MKVSKYLVFALCASFAGTALGSWGDSSYRRKLAKAINNGSISNESTLEGFIKEGRDDVIFSHGALSLFDGVTNKIFSWPEWENSGQKTLCDVAVHLSSLGKDAQAAMVFANIFFGQWKNFNDVWNSDAYRRHAFEVRIALKKYIVPYIPENLKGIKVKILPTSRGYLSGFPKEVTVKEAMYLVLGRCEIFAGMAFFGSSRVNHEHSCSWGNSSYRRKLSKAINNGSISNEISLEEFIKEGRDNVIVSHGVLSLLDDVTNKIFSGTKGGHSGQKTLLDVALHLSSSGKDAQAAMVFANIFFGQWKNFNYSWHRNAYRRRASKIRAALNKYIVPYIPQNLKGIKVEILPTSSGYLSGFPKEATVEEAMEKCFATCDQY